MHSKCFFPYKVEPLLQASRTIIVRPQRYRSGLKDHLALLHISAPTGPGFLCTRYQVVSFFSFFLFRFINGYDAFALLCFEQQCYYSQDLVDPVPQRGEQSEELIQSQLKVWTRSFVAMDSLLQPFFENTTHLKVVHDCRYVIIPYARNDSCPFVIFVDSTIVRNTVQRERHCLRCWDRDFIKQCF
jgi:hypothetical protein